LAPIIMVSMVLNNIIMIMFCNR